MDHPQNSTPHGDGSPVGTRQPHGCRPPIPAAGHQRSRTAGGHRGPRRARRGSITLLTMLAAMAIVGLSCTDDNRPPLLSGLGEQSIGLQTDLSCDDLVAATQEQFEYELELAEKRSMKESLDEPTFMPGPAQEMQASDSDSSGSAGDAARDVAPSTEDTATQESAAPTTALSGEAGATSDEGGEGGDVVAGTNNQESGVDEADIIKTDGKRIVSLVDGVLRVVGLDDTPAVDGALDLRSFGADGGDMFLRGDEVLLLLPSWGNVEYRQDDMGLPGDASAPSAGTAESVEPRAGSDGATDTGTETTVPDTAPPDTTPRRRLHHDDDHQHAPRRRLDDHHDDSPDDDDHHHHHDYHHHDGSYRTRPARPHPLREGRAAPARRPRLRRRS
ncbi:MAG: beta-propeller domain-containing protein [Microthrixaceae bacterium]|nr:beta-propeller domain-containing protein [Microthrixaceae bacterium]